MPHPNIWELAVSQLLENGTINPRDHRNWFEATRMASCRDEEVVIEVETAFYVDWMTDHYHDICAKALGELDPNFKLLRFQSNPEGWEWKRIWEMVKDHLRVAGQGNLFEQGPINLSSQLGFWRGVLVIGVPSQDAKKEIENGHLNQIRAALDAIQDKVGVVVDEVELEVCQEEKSSRRTSSATPPPKPFVLPTNKSKKAFEDLTIFQGNFSAMAMTRGILDAVEQEKDGNLSGTLYLWGDPGSGKSALATALADGLAKIVKEKRKKTPNPRTLVIREISTVLWYEAFQAMCAEAHGGKNTGRSELRALYDREKCFGDVVIFHDLHVLFEGDKHASKVEFLRVLKTLTDTSRANGVLVIFTAHQPPHRLHGLGKEKPAQLERELLSLLEQGDVLRLTPPIGEESCLDFLRCTVSNWPDTVVLPGTLELLAEALHDRDMRSLVGLLSQLRRTAERIAKQDKFASRDNPEGKIPINAKAVKELLNSRGHEYGGRLAGSQPIEQGQGATHPSSIGTVIDNLTVYAEEGGQISFVPPKKPSNGRLRVANLLVTETAREFGVTRESITNGDSILSPATEIAIYLCRIHPGLGDNLMKRVFGRNSDSVQAALNNIRLILSKAETEEAKRVKGNIDRITERARSQEEL